MRLADFLEQVEVLHVAGADLEHVGVLLDELDLPRVHDLGDDRHAVLVADVAEDLAAPPRPAPGSCRGWCAA